MHARVNHNISTMYNSCSALPYTEPQSTLFWGSVVYFFLDADYFLDKIFFLS